MRTPSPWRITYRKGTNIVGPDSDYVCLVGGDQDTAVEKSRLEDDAQFIVAACNNYERVCAAVQTLHTNLIRIEAEREAFKRERNELAGVLRELLAEVEDFHVSTGHEEEGGSVQCDEICALMPKARAALAKVSP